MWDIDNHKWSIFKVLMKGPSLIINFTKLKVCVLF